MTSLEKWLSEIGLAQYARVFAENAIDLEVLSELTDSELESLGVLLGHRKKLRRAFANQSVRTEPDEGEEAAKESVTRATGERRNLTVMFCDLVGSTALSERLDPEDLREMLRAYQEVCYDVVNRYEGYVSQLIGDGLLIYFGYPQAHEDDAQRAVRAGLSIIDKMGPLNQRLYDELGETLGIRLGIHTGLVVVGEMGAGHSRDETAIVGETPNIAARLESIAEPNTVVVSASTYGLIAGIFDCEDRGPQRLKGVSDPVPVYRVREERHAASRFEAEHRGWLTPLVGREEEIDLLLRRWEQAKDCEGQVVLLSGEAGIGKSRIVQTLQERLADEPHRLVRFQGSPYHTNTALHPVIIQLESAAGFQRHDSASQKLRKLASLFSQFSDDIEDTVPIVAALLSIPYDDLYETLDLPAQQRKARTLAALTEFVLSQATHQPILILLEDAHWIDPTTLEYFDRLVDQAQENRVLIVITYRPEFAPPWSNYAHATSLSLNRLGRRLCAAMVERVAGSIGMPQEVIEQIVAKTDGVPLFVEELTKTMLDALSSVKGRDNQKATSDDIRLAIPSTLQDSLMARLDRLSPVKYVAQIGAAIGRQFSFELIASVAPIEEEELRSALNQLVESELVLCRGIPPDATYRFKHALVQDAAYASLLKSRRIQLHGRIVHALEEHFPERAQFEHEFLAYHCAEGGLIDKAIEYWGKAGEQAISRSATAESVVHLTKALEALARLPDDQAKWKRELGLQTMLGWALVSARGYAAPETGKTFARAHQLCLELGDSDQLLPVLCGKWTHYLLRAEVDRAHGVGQQLLNLVEERADTASLVIGHRIYGASSFWRGDFEVARNHLEKALSLYAPSHVSPSPVLHMIDARVMGLDFMSLVMLVLGNPEQATVYSEEALAEAEKLSHSVTLAIVLQHSCMFYQLARKPQVVQARAERLLSLATERRFPFWVAHAKFFKNWALVEANQTPERVTVVRDTLNTIEDTNEVLFLPYYFALLANVYIAAKRWKAAGELLEDALSRVHHSGEKWFQPELLRLNGERLLNEPESDKEGAEASFRQALEIAHRQGARLWELRAAISLCRLWRGQNQMARALDLLEPIGSAFGEGADFPDLVDARSLIEELS